MRNAFETGGDRAQFLINTFRNRNILFEGVVTENAQRRGSRSRAARCNDGIDCAATVGGGVCNHRHALDSTLSSRSPAATPCVACIVHILVRINLHVDRSDHRAGGIERVAIHGWPDLLPLAIHAQGSRSRHTVSVANGAVRQFYLAVYTIYPRKNATARV